MIPRENYRDAGPKMANMLAFVFAQFEPDADRDVTITERAPRDWWNGSPLIGTRDPHDVRAHIAEFRERMRQERARWL